MSAAPTRPPAVARWILTRVLPAPEREFVLGDLGEHFDILAAQRGPRAARRWYRRQAWGLVWHRPGRQSRPVVSLTQKGDSLMRTLWHDSRYALRALARQPSYSLVAVLSLALAIAANGLVYGLVDNLVLNPFQFPQPDRLVGLGSTFPRLSEDLGFMEQHSTLEIEDVRQARTIRNLAAFDLGNRAVSNGTDARREFAALIINDPLPALGQVPRLGRGFTAEELRPGGPAVVILGYRVWRDLFGGDDRIIGRSVQINSTPRVVVGVLDERTSLLGTGLWIPWGADPLTQPRNQRQFTALARLADGRSLADANAELAAIASRSTTLYQGQFEEYAGYRLRVLPWTEAITGPVRGVATLLLVAGALVLVIACTNLTGLMLVRLNSRRRELGVRFALGAGHWQVTRLFLIESVLIAALAGALGLALAQAALGPLPQLLPDQVSSLGITLGINLRVILYCTGVALAAALLTTLVPAWQARRANPRQGLRDGGPGAAGGRQRVRRALVIAQLALAVILLVSAGQMLVSFSRLQHADAGFRIDHVATMRLTLARERYRAPGAATQFFNEFVGRLAAMPGVVAAAATSQFPPSQGFRTGFKVEGSPRPAGDLPSALITTVTPQIFDVLGMKIVHGRALSAADRPGAPTAVVVNEAFVRRYLNGRPEGRLTVGRNATPAEVVGVVADARNASMLLPAEPEIFATIDQAGDSNQYFVVARTTSDPMAAMPEIRRTLAGLDPDQPLYFVQSMAQAVDAALFAQRVALVLVGVFAAGAMLVAALGVYGIVAFHVAARTREIGIRVALGATASRVTRVVVGQSLRLLLAGAVLGLAGGVYAARLTTSLLYEAARVDLLAILGVLGVLVLVGIVASWLPSRRALRIDPIVALRTD